MIQTPDYCQYSGFKACSVTIYLTKNVSLFTGSFPMFPREMFCILTCERKTGTPVFQKTAAKKIKIIVIIPSFLNCF